MKWARWGRAESVAGGDSVFRGLEAPLTLVVEVPVLGGLRLAGVEGAGMGEGFIFVKTVLLLVCSNVFMTLAWYGHLKFKFLDGKALWVVVLVSWGIAFFEYCLMVPANRLGYFSEGFSGYQLKVLQECVTLGVFVVFAWAVLGERLTWNYMVSFALLVGAVYFAVGVKAG